MLAMFFGSKTYFLHRSSFNASSMLSRPQRVRTTVATLLLHITLLISPTVGGNICDILPREFADLFMSALDALETRVADEVDAAFEEIGLGPFGNSLLAHNLYDFKDGMFDELFGTKVERTAWINGTTGSAIEVYKNLNANIINVVGDASLVVTCVSEEDKYTMDLTVHGKLLSIGAPEELRVTLLPSEYFLPLGLNVAAIDVEYALKMPFSLYRGLNKIFLLGETQATLSVNIASAISESIPILSNADITFDGNFDFNATLSYSSIEGLSSYGRFNSKLTAEVFDKYVGIRAQDGNIFDTVPRK
jgi:hypothetical protein